MGHRQSLSEVFSNLLSNAIKFSNKESEIIFEGQDSKLGLDITIKDFGVGFGEATKKTLFRKFIPGHMGTNGEPSTGLGLYLSKRIIENHGGSLEAFSDGLNKGATFTISLPKH